MEEVRASSVLQRMSTGKSAIVGKILEIPITGIVFITTDADTIKTSFVVLIIHVADSEKRERCCHYEETQGK